MDISGIAEIISTLGFPIATAIVLAYFIYKMIHLNAERTERILTILQDSSNSREERLMKELADCRQVNEKAIETIACYAEKLETIQKDVSEIKTNILCMSAMKKD